MKINFKMFKPFGSTIARAELPLELLKDFIGDLKSIRADENKKKEHQFGDRLAGQIKEEYLISHEPMLKWKQQFFDPIITSYAEAFYKGRKVKKVFVTAAWYVCQQPGDYNCLHTHTNYTDFQTNPDLSCVGYLKIPNLKPYANAKQHHDTSNMIEFVEGSQNVFTDSNYLVKPEVRTWYLFPANLLHTVYPFFTDDVDNERISFSFNAKIIFNDS